MTGTPSDCPRCGAPPDPEAGICLRCVAASTLADEAAEPARSTREPLDLASIAPHFPSYEIGAEVGRGATGAVHRARHRALGRDFALKIIAADVAARPGFAERFEREVRTVGRLSHPGIVSVHDAGRAGPWFYLAMEHVDGADLRQMLAAGTVTARDALAIVTQMCEALQYAHDEGVVHRDIKPENVLVDRRGRVRILDFGLAQVARETSDDPNLTRSGHVVGTPLYMAPEQWRAPLEVDHRADIYSLGVVFYELLTGELPVGRFPPPSRRAVVDARLDEVVMRTLEREPERRYQNASDVRADIGAATTAQSPFVNRSSRNGAKRPNARISAVDRARRLVRDRSPFERMHDWVYGDDVLKWFLKWTIALVVLMAIVVAAILLFAFGGVMFGRR